MNLPQPTILLRKWIITLVGLFLSVNALFVRAQVNTGGNATTTDHQKEVIGYITNWDAWKSASAGVPSAGALTHLNIDYSKYTILNYSFFGVAVDGSLHSGDLRNKNIHQEGAVQEPSDIFFTSVYDSWDMLLLFGEIEPVHYISEAIKTRAEAQGFVVEVNGNTWEHPDWGLDGTLPLPLHKEDGAPGILELAHQNSVKVMASIGGWSMCKHFPEMAADPQKRATFIADCQKLIDTGFDGIDLDWEYPGPYEGMNFTGSAADFANFLTLVQELRAAIGPDKLITAAFSAAPEKIQGFNWAALAGVMDYFNFMTYDFNGGWSDKAGHNSPLYPYDDAEVPGFNWQSTLDAITALGVPKNKVNFGIPFYGRGVVTDGAAGLNTPTQKRNETVQPDGAVVTAADFVNWPRDVYDGTPNHFYIKQQALGTGGWTRHWDDQAKVPYLTRDNYFLSYDDEESITLKSQYIVDNDLAGTIVWTVYGDLEFSGSPETYGNKLKRWPDMASPLVNTINEVFAGNSDELPVAQITAPASEAVFDTGEDITIEVSTTGENIAKVEFYNGEEKLGEDTEAPFSFTWNNIPAGNHNITAMATSAAGTTSTSESVAITVNDNGDCSSSFRIIGYMPSWQGTASEIQYDKLTHIIYAFINPQASGDGSLTAVENPGKLQQIVSNAHASGVKVMIAVGGWTDLNNPGFETLSASPAARQNFADNLLSLVNQYNLDGVDIDWEYPREGDQPQNYVAMMQKLGEVMHNNGKLLSAAVAAVGYYADGILPEVFPYMDFLNLMAYDGGSGATHSPYSYAVQTLDYWLGKGLPASKAVLGVPFYARPSWNSYSQLVANGADPYSDTYNGDYYNGINTIRQKTQLAADRASGIMIWELSHDTNNNIPISLLNAIYDEAPDDCQGDGNPSVHFTDPSDGSTVTTGTAITLSVNASDDGGITGVVFEVNGQTIPASGSGSTYTASWTPSADGSYTITATATDNDTNTASAQITVTATSGSGCSAPAWDAGATYLNGDEVSHNGGLYRAKWWTLNENPETHSAEWDVWEYIGPCNGTNLAKTDTVRTSGPVLYPNPFSDTATLDIDIKASGNTKILIYNRTGVPVKKMYDKFLQKGKHQITIDGSRLSPGIYFLKLHNDHSEPLTIPVIKR